MGIHILVGSYSLVGLIQMHMKGIISTIEKHS